MTGIINVVAISMIVRIPFIIRVFCGCPLPLLLFCMFMYPLLFDCRFGGLPADPKTYCLKCSTLDEGVITHHFAGFGATGRVLNKVTILIKVRIISAVN